MSGPDISISQQEFHLIKMPLVSMPKSAASQLSTPAMARIAILDRVSRKTIRSE